MNEYTNESLGRKIITIVGFLILIAFTVWVAVRIVAFIPSAFSSLASIADGVYGERPQNEIIIANQNSIVNNGDAITLTWTDLKRNGVYTFQYECTDGVAIDMRHPGNAITSVPCGEMVTLGADVTRLEITTNSEKRRFIDVPYIIGFVATGDDEMSYEKATTITVVNANIPQSQSIAADDTDSDTTDEVIVEEPVVAVDPEVTTPVVTTPVVTPKPVVPQEPRVIATEIFELPTSDPNGYVDLAVKYIGVGTLSNNNRFTATTEIDNDRRGAFQFEVRNLGTKTSKDWTFDATLTSGTVYESKKQDGLLPNERSIITLGFDSVGNNGTQKFGAEVDVDNDINTKNNDFVWAVKVVD